LDRCSDLDWRGPWCFFLYNLFFLCSPLILSLFLRYLFIILSWRDAPVSRRNVDLVPVVPMVAHILSP
jgi:hypothetical protein